MHFFQQSIIIDHVDDINENVNIVHKINNNDFTRRLFKNFNKFALYNKYKINNINVFYDMSTLTLFIIVCFVFTIKLILLSCMKLFVQATIHIEI